MMKCKISLLSIAMATIVLVSMGAVAGVSAAQPATVGAPISGAPAVCYDGANLWYVAQGAAATSGNIYYKNGTGAWSPAIGSATSAAIVCQGAPGDVAIFVRGTNGGLYEKKTTDGGTNWSGWYAWPGQLAAGTSPAAVWNETTKQTDVFYVNSANNHLSWDSQALGNIQQTDLGGIVTATPGAVRTAIGTDVIVRGTSGALYERINNGRGFASWTAFHDGVLLAGTGPTVVSNGAGGIYVFVTGTTLHMYMVYSLDNGLTWETINQVTGNGSHVALFWLNLNGTLTSSPSAAYTGNASGANIAVIVRGSDGGIWTDTGSAPYNTTSNWSWSTTSIAGP